MSSTIWGDKFARKLRTLSKITGTEWADKKRYVPPPSPATGRWKTSRTPYLAEPMNVATDRETVHTVMMCSSQVGKSEFLLNIMGYYADQEPASQLMLQPRIEDCEAFSKERIDPMFQYSPGLKGKLEEGKDGRGTSRKSSTTIRMKHYPGGFLALVGANSPAGLASRAIRILLCDEIDRFGYTKEGDPLKLAIQRTTNYHNKKICLVSTPTIDKQSKIQEWWDKSDKRYYYLPCPHCGTSQKLVWSQVKWERDEDGTHHPETAYYECEHCKEAIHDSDKHDMLQMGYWEASEPESKIAGFHVNSLYSPWVKFAALAEEFVEVTKNRDKKGLMEFINLKLGEPWVESDDDFNHTHLHRRREYYNADLPAKVLLLSAGVDVQHDRIEAELVGWGKGKESWGIEYKVFMGNPGLPQVWKDLDAWLLNKWQHEKGHQMGISGACIDSSDGHFMQEVYEFTKPREQRRIFAIKGRGGLGNVFINKPTRNNRIGAALFTIGVDAGKANIMARVRIEDEGPGYCHWPRDGEKGFNEEYFKGLLSEKYVFKYVNGQTKTEWKKIHERNEPLDCRNYATASMEILSPNFELLEHHLVTGQTTQKSGKTRPRKKGPRVLSKGVT